MRKKLYEIIEISNETHSLGRAYDVMMMVTIIASLLPLAFKHEDMFLFVLDKAAAGIFIIDYILRWITADFKIKTHPFVKYPFTPMAIVDLVSILPSFHVLNQAFKSLRVLRLMKTFRVFRAVRYSKNLQTILNVLRESKQALLTVGGLAVGYVIVSALVAFNAEPEAFETFFDAVYWAVVLLTTVGYGDVVPVTVLGRSITILSSFVGIAIIALPTGIIAAGYMKEMGIEKD